MAKILIKKLPWHSTASNQEYHKDSQSSHILHFPSNASSTLLMLTGTTRLKKQCCSKKHISKSFSCQLAFATDATINVSHRQMTSITAFHTGKQMLTPFRRSTKTPCIICTCLTDRTTDTKYNSLTAGGFTKTQKDQRFCWQACAFEGEESSLKSIGTTVALL